MNKMFKIVSVLGLVFALTSPAFAAIVTVTSDADSGVGTLRQAIADASSGDTIIFDLSDYNIQLFSSLTLDKSLTIWGPGREQLAIRGDVNVRVFDVTAGTSTITDLTVSSGALEGNTRTGAGFRLAAGATLTVDRCGVNSNVLFGSGLNYGAAFFNPAGATLNVYRSFVYGNFMFDVIDCEGAAFYNEGNLNIVGCVIMGNTARMGAAVMNRGGAGTTVNIISTTVTDNTTTYNGPIVNQGLGTMNLTNCTITDNNSAQYEAGLFATSGLLTLRNTVIAANVAFAGGGNTDIYFLPGTTMTSYGYNFIGSTGSQTYPWTTGDVVGTEPPGMLDPNLGPLSDHGGYTYSHAPNTGSPLIDPASSNGAPFVDQRGRLRIGTADKGAHEFKGIWPTAQLASDNTGTGFTANWTAATGALGYLLDVSDNANFATRVPGYWHLNVGNTSNYGVTGLTEGTTYYYRVRGYNGVQHTCYTNSITAVAMAPSPTPTATHSPTSTPTGVPDQNKTLGRAVLAYPNPARDRVVFTWQETDVDEVHIEIYNLNGESIARVRQVQPGQSVVWRIGDIAPGIYIYRARVKIDGQEKDLGSRKIAIVR